MSNRITHENDKITCEVSDKQGKGSRVITSEDSIKIEFNKPLLEALQNEQTQLLNKLAKIRQEDNYGTYKNIIMALSEVTRLIEKESWRDMYSHYQLRNDDFEFEEVISTWKQKGEDIRDHHIYKIDGEIPTVKIKIDKENMIETDYELTVPLIIDDKLKHEIKLKKENGKIICL